MFGSLHVSARRPVSDADTVTLPSGSFVAASSTADLGRAQLSADFSFDSPNSSQDLVNGSAVAGWSDTFVALSASGQDVTVRTSLDYSIQQSVDSTSAGETNVFGTFLTRQFPPPGIVFGPCVPLPA